MSNSQEFLALSNPIWKITGKKRDELTREDILKVIFEKQIERITFHYTSIDGKLKELRLPVTKRKQVELFLTQGERIDGSSLFKGMIDAGKSDMYVVPVYSTAFFNPFDNKSLDFICRFVSGDGELVPFAPDNILQRAANKFKEDTGYELYSLGELEFYLIGNPTNDLYPLPKQRGYHGSPPYTKTNDMVHEMLNYISQITGDIKYVHNEVGHIDHIQSEYPLLKDKMAEQVEIEFLPTPITETGDIVVLAAWIIRNVAYRHGFYASFYPKLDINHAGNGLHFHLQLQKDGRNAMVNPDNSLSEAAHTFIGGLCNYAASLTAFGNMTAGSYLRLVPHQEAPTKVCWSESNRSALVRVPLGWTGLDNLASVVNPQQTIKLEDIDSVQTIEIRSPDGSANAHLMLAGISQAAIWSFENKEEALALAEKSYVQGNIHSNPNIKELDDLATSCVHSAEILIENKHKYELYGIFPESVINWVANYLMNENDKGLNKRLMVMPHEEMLFEARKIMHSNILKH